MDKLKTIIGYEADSGKLFLKFNHIKRDKILLKQKENTQTDSKFKI